MPSALSSQFELAAGSVIGRRHLDAGKGNQDAFAWRESAGGIVAVVCDGCGSGEHSEVGAQLGARLLVEELTRALEANAKLDELQTWEGVRTATLAKLREVATSLGGSFDEVVSELLLFTVVGVAMTETLTSIFSIGDGLFALNGEVKPLGPFPGNAPPYLSYGLVERDGPRFVTQKLVATSEVKHLLLGTDGAGDLQEVAARNLPGATEPIGPLSQFWLDDRYFKNRDAIRRRLAMANREISRPIWAEQRVAKEGGLLPDDTTLLVLRRKS